MNSTETLESILMDRVQRIETFMNVADKSSRIVPFRLNTIQELELTTQSEMKRDLFLKPAQVGSTTLWVADFLMDTMLNENRTSVILAHEEFISQRLLLKAQSLYSNLIRGDESGGPIMYWPELGRNSANEMFFPELHSTLYIGSARSYVFGRGEPIHNLLCSEVAFYQNATRTIGPAQDRVPMDGGCIVLESTPNGEEGEGAFFCQTYKAGREGNSIYQPHFFRWFDHKEYYIPEGSPLALPQDRGILDMTEEEADLCARFSLDEGHIRWRRRKMLEKRQAYETGEDRLLFQQEFPEDDINCFLVAGDQAYDSNLVEQLAKKCFIPKGEKSSYDGAMVWFPPEEGHSYDVTIDPSLGTGKAGNSKTVVQVWEFWNDEDSKEHARHCATSSGYFTAEIAAGKALSLADYYNKARIIIETNPPGIPIAVILQNYPYLYIREDVISGKRTTSIGWLTTPRTKPYMISEMVRMLPRLETYDYNLVSQFRNMRYIGNNVVAVGPDDHHDAAAIAMACRRSRRQSTSGFVGTTRGWKD